MRVAHIRGATRVLAVVIEPPKGRLLSRVHVHASVKRAATQSAARPRAGGAARGGAGGGGAGGGDAGGVATDAAALAEMPMPKEAARRAFQPAPRLATLDQVATEEAEGLDASEAAEVDLGLRHT